MIGFIIIGLVGILCVVIGYLIGKKEKISLLHDYHYEKVAEEDKPAFCKLMGLAVTAIGISLLITGVLLAITNSLWSFLPLIVGFFVSIYLFIYADRKYNR